MIASQAIARAYDILKSIGWPECSPMQAMNAVAMRSGDLQTRLVWEILTRQAVLRRRRYTGIHPINELHEHTGQSWAGIQEYMLDCVDLAESHPLNGEMPS